MSVVGGPSECTDVSDLYCEGGMKEREGEVWEWRSATQLLNCTVLLPRLHTPNYTCSLVERF